MHIRRVAAAIALLLCSVLAAQDRPPVPAAYVQQPCAAVSLCSVIDHLEKHLAFYRAHYRRDVSDRWIAAHVGELRPALDAICLRTASCFAVPDNKYTFCNDAAVEKTRAVCDRYPTATNDHEQCAFYVDALMLAQDRESRALWEAAQACSASRGIDAGATDVAPRTWMIPARIAASYRGDIRIFAEDTETKLPIEGRITVGSQVIYSTANPGGLPTTWYPFHGPFKLSRVRRADGHEDLVVPAVKITFPHHPAVEFPLPADIPAIDVSVSTDLTKLKPGKHTITIKAVDRVTGKPAEMRVLAGEEVLGDTNLPIELTIAKKKKRPEIWLTSLFDAYSDVVVAPAK